MSMAGKKPTWLTFDCYGTLVRFDEGLLGAVEEILASRDCHAIDPSAFIDVYDKHEHALEQRKPHRSFRAIASEALQKAMDQFDITCENSDTEILTTAIPRMPPFPEAVPTLRKLKNMGLQICIISNTDDDIIAGNVAQMDGLVDKVITAQQAQAYKPSREIFEYAHRRLGAGPDDIVHVCASPHLDLVAAREMGFRCIWIDRGTGRLPLPDYEPDEVFSTLEPVPECLWSATWN